MIRNVGNDSEISPATRACLDSTNSTIVMRIIENQVWVVAE